MDAGEGCHDSFICFFFLFEVLLISSGFIPCSFDVLLISFEKYEQGSSHYGCTTHISVVKNIIGLHSLPNEIFQNFRIFFFNFIFKK